jgi:hypothetical protein
MSDLACETTSIGRIPIPPWEAEQQFCLELDMVSLH